MVSDLAVYRGGRCVLAGLSFALGAGEALVLRGPNGSGKTTLLRTVAGLQPPLGGAIRGAGDAVAYAGHADGIKFGLSVAENLAFWADVFGAGGVEAAMSHYALRPLAERRAGDLSAGQKRRLGLARLLVTGRPLWVLDEPTVSLDADATVMFADAVRAHLGQGGAALIATHIDLGLQQARFLDVARFAPGPEAAPRGSDAAFL